MKNSKNNTLKEFFKCFHIVEWRYVNNGFLSFTQGTVWVKN